MKKSLFLILSSLCALTCCEKAFAYSTAGGCKTYVHGGAGITVATWTQQDPDTGYYSIYGGIGVTTSIGDAPGDWTSIVDITPAGAASDITTDPHLYMCENTGDMIAVWQFLDQTLYIMRVAAAILPVGSTTWNSTILSDPSITNESGGNEDEKASIDADGNIIVTWSMFNMDTYQSVVRCITGTVSGGFSGYPFIIPGADSLNQNKAKRMLPPQLFPQKTIPVKKKIK